eukprot:Tbor_TRINITY_DN2983_c0_g1::TRINITY_DN2983_c0_g1_i1::g.1046::m.1046
MAPLQQRSLKKPRGEPQHKLDKSSKKVKDLKKIQEERERVRRVAALAAKLRDEVSSEEKRVRESRRANAQRKVDNEKKNMVTQNIKNIKAIKKLSPKQRRKARIYLKHEM